MRVSIDESHFNGALDLPAGHRQTSSLRECGEKAMDDSNEAEILRQLRALDAKEGKCRDRLEYTLEIEEEGDWYFHNDTIIYRCPLDGEAFKRALTSGAGYEWVQGWTFDRNGDEVADDDYEREVCPVLDLLIDIKSQLNNYPVLDDEDYDRRCHEARIEMVRDSLPMETGRDGKERRMELTDDECSRIVWALSQYSWPPDDPNESGIAAKYQVEWTGDNDYSIYGNHLPVDGGKPREWIDLDDCVKAAIKALKIRFYRRRKVG
jgi:hypothetical protein